MNNALHFVGFADPQRYANAARVFGHPDFVHRHWDARARAEIFPGDVTVFAGYYRTEPSVHAYDDSANQ